MDQKSSVTFVPGGLLIFNEEFKSILSSRNIETNFPFKMQKKTYDKQTTQNYNLFKEGQSYKYFYNRCLGKLDCFVDYCGRACSKVKQARFLPILNPMTLALLFEGSTIGLLRQNLDLDPNQNVSQSKRH